MLILAGYCYEGYSQGPNVLATLKLMGKIKNALD